MVVEQNTDGVNFYNILTKSSPMSAVESSLEFTQSHLVRLFQRHVRHLQQNALSQLMNGPIRKKLKIIPEDCFWGGQATNVFLNMEGDFMKPVISIVDELLEAGVNVTVYNGQLDLIVDTMGQEAWLRKLKWAELPKFNQLRWKPLYSDPKSSETSAFVKSYKNLAFYWILRAGHMVPSDQGDMALKMLRLVTQQEEGAQAGGEPLGLGKHPSPFESDLGEEPDLGCDCEGYHQLPQRTKLLPLWQLGNHFCF